MSSSLIKKDFLTNISFIKVGQKNGKAVARVEASYAQKITSPPDVGKLTKIESKGRRPFSISNGMNQLLSKAVNL